jgi:uncharacterized membrane protein YhaH (DUF805 family)
MGFADAVETCLKKYVVFQGRAVRSEFWFFVLFSTILGIATYYIDIWVVGYPVLYTIAAFGLLLPSLAVSVRRLHDTDRSGWWIFLCLVPLVGTIVQLVWFCTRGSAAANRFG